MAVRGMSDEVMSALEFDPFSALDNGSGGQDQGQRPGGQSVSREASSQQPPARERTPTAGTPAPAQQDVKPAKVPVPGRDPSTGKFTAQPAQKPAPQPVPQRQPTQAAQPEPEAGNTVEELMNRLRESPAMLFSGASGQAAPDVGAPPPQQAPGGGAPGQQMQWGYDYSRPWAEQRVDLPPQLLDAIFHEDRNVAAQGMGVLINTMYNSIMNDVHTRVAEVLRNAPVMTSAVADMTSARQALKTKFYGKFAELSDPVGMQTVYTLASNIANVYQQMGQQVDPMSDDFIDYVGTQALQMLGRVRKQPEPRRQFQTGSATREANGAGNPFMESIGMA